MQTLLEARSCVGLPNCISRPWDEIVDCRKRDVTIGAARIPVIPEAITQGEVGLYLPTVANVGADPVSGPKPPAGFPKRFSSVKDPSPFPIVTESAV